MHPKDCGRTLNDWLDISLRVFMIMCFLIIILGSFFMSDREFDKEKYSADHYKVIPVDWERLELPEDYPHILRTSVPGGWLVVFSKSKSNDKSGVFIPDPEHKWLIDLEQKE